ncbi:MAG: 3-deoxy-7-phosphoheptulonate synthase, partial [Lachnospiraceae bacterium]
MSFTRIRQVISPEELKDLYPLSREAAQVKADRDAEMKRIIAGESDRFMVIVGPCSADNETAVLDYINRLAKVQEKVADKLFLVPRIYTNKPRTTGEGYKGIVHKPDPEKGTDF